MLNNGHTSCYRHPATKDKELRVATAGGVVYLSGSSGVDLGCGVAYRSENVGLAQEHGLS